MEYYAVSRIIGINRYIKCAYNNRCNRTQEKITKKIVKKGGHSVFKVKENQKELQKDIKNILTASII